MKYPAELYHPSPRKYDPRQPLEPLHYPLHDLTLKVYPSGSVRGPFGREVYISRALRGENVGLRELEHQQWLVTFMDLDLGVIAPAQRRLIAC